MNWKLILALSSYGLAIGIGSLFGVGPTGFIWWFLWLNLFLVYAWLIATRASGKYFLHGFIVWILNSGWITSIHAYYLFDLSRGNGLVEILPYGFHPQVWNLLLGLTVGVVNGTIAGLFASVAARVLKPGDAQESEAAR